MSGHENRAFTGHLVGHCDRLLRIAGVIADDQTQLLTQHATGGIDVGHGLLGTGFHLGAK